MNKVTCDIGINLRCIICNVLYKHIDDIHYDDVCYNCINIQNRCERQDKNTVTVDKKCFHNPCNCEGSK